MGRKNRSKFDHARRLRRSRNAFWTHEFWTKFLKNFLGVIVFDGKIENFFITDSRSTSHDPCSSDGIFGISTSVPEVAIFFRTKGPRASGSETMLFSIKSRFERRLNHSAISFRSGCVLLEAGISAIFSKYY